MFSDEQFRVVFHTLWNYYMIILFVIMGVGVIASLIKYLYNKIKGEK
jgi:hypothetical protein